MSASTSFTSTAAATAISISSTLTVKGKKIHIIITVDISGSMTRVLQQLLDAINDVLGHLKEQFGDQEVTITIVTFSNSVQVVLPQTNLKDFSLIQPLHADGGTALNDAIMFVDQMIKAPEYAGQKILITVTDGDENASNKEHTNELISKILQGYLETLSNPESAVTFTLAGANQNTVEKVATFGLPPTSALNFNIGYVQGCASALGNMLGRVASGQDSTPSVQHDDRLMSCPMDYDQGASSPCVLQSHDSQWVMTRTHSGPSDYIPTEYDDDSTPSYYQGPSDQMPSEYDDDSTPSRHPISFGFVDDSTPSRAPSHSSHYNPYEGEVPSFGSSLGVPDWYKGPTPW